MHGIHKGRLGMKRKMKAKIPPGKELKYGIQIHVLRDGTFGITTNTEMTDTEIACRLTGALGVLLSKIHREKNETEVDKARKNVIVPPPGFKIPKEGIRAVS